MSKPLCTLDKFSMQLVYFISFAIHSYLDDTTSTIFLRYIYIEVIPRSKDINVAHVSLWIFSFRETAFVTVILMAKDSSDSTQYQNKREFEQNTETSTNL